MVVSRQCAESNRLTALKTVSARIRGAKSELSELGEDVEEFNGGAKAFSKYAKEIQALTGFDIMEDASTNTYKDIYDIFEGISKSWDRLNDTQRSRVSEILGGTRQLQVISSIIGNWEDATGAYAAAMDSAGTATEANSIYMETAAAHINQFKSAFQEMSSSVVNSDIISLFADLGILILNIINNTSKLVDTLGGLKTVLIGITGAIVAAKLPGIITKIGSIGTAISSIINKTVALGVAISSYKANGASGLAAVSSGFKAIGLSISSAQIALSSFTIVLTAGIAIFSAWKRHAEETSAAIKQAGEDAASENEAIIKNVFEMNDVYNKYKEGTASKSDLNSATEALNSSLEKENRIVKGLSESYGEYIGKLEDVSLENINNNIVAEINAVKEAEEDLIKEAKNGAFDDFSGTTGGMVPRDYYTDYKIYDKDDIDKYQRALSGLSKYFEILETGGGGTVHGLFSSENLKTTDDIINAYNSVVEAMRRMNAEGLSETSLYKDLKEAWSSIKDEVEKYLETTSSLNSDSAYSVVLQQMKDARKAAKDGSSGLPKTQKEFEDFRDAAIEAAKDSNEFVGSNRDIEASIDDVLSKISDFSKFYDDVASGASNAADANKSLASTISDLESVKTSMTSLAKIYGDIVDGGGFDVSAAVSDDFVNAFGNLDSYNEFLSVVANSPDDIDACSKAISGLAKDFITSKLNLGELNEENARYIEASLKSIGVTNAHEVVVNALSKQTLQLTGNVLKEAEAEYGNAAASGVLTKAQATLLAEKMRLNSTELKTSDDIKSMLELANAAGASADAISRLTDVEAAYTRAESIKSAAEAYKKKFPSNYEVYSHMLDAADVAYADAIATKKAVMSRVGFSKMLYDDIKIDLPTMSNSLNPSNSTKSSSSSTKTKAQEAFEKEYARRKHQLEMEEITQKQYLDWLNGAYKKVYKNGTDEYWKYEEEVKKGYRQLEIDAFEKTYDKNNHLVNMERMTQSDYLNWLNGAYKKVYKVGTDEYNKYEEEVFKGLEDLRKRAEDALDKLVDYEVDMLKKGTEKEKDELQNRLDKLKDFYDKQKEMLREQYDEEDYIAEQAKKRKAVTDLQMQISWLSMDNSAAAQKKLAELSQELRDAREDLTEFEKDYALDAAEKMYDDLYEKEEASIQSEIDSLDSMLNSPEAYFNRALSDIKDNTKHSAEELYKTMVLYNRMFGDGNDQTVKGMWKEAYDTGVVSLNPSKISIAKTDNLVAPKDVNGDSSINMKDTLQARQILAGMLANDSGLTMKDVLAIRKYLAGLIDESGIPTWMWDYVYAINHGHASGTKSSTAGLHRIFENGPELEFQSSNGNTYRMLGAGDMILPAKATSFLYDFAVAGSKMVGGLTGGSPASIIGAMSGGNRSISVTMSPISIYGNANQQTVSEMRRAQRDALNDTLKAFAKLNK